MKLSHWQIVAVAFSCVLLIATGFLWVRSCDVFDVFVWSRATFSAPQCALASHAVGIGRGRLILYHYEWLEASGGNGRSIDKRFASGRLVFERQLTPVTASKSKRVIPWYGFDAEGSDTVLPTGNRREGTIWIPLWLPALLFTAFPAFVLILYVKKRYRLAM
jgi:hypothetical protein